MTDSFPERFELFARTRERMSSALIVALRLLWPQVIADLYDAERAADSARRIQAMRAAALRLEREQADRIGRIAPWLNERTIGCLELAGQIDMPTDGAQAWALVGNEELETRIAAAHLARQIRRESREFHLQYAGRIASLTQRHWPLDELMPLGASALAMAVFTAFDDLSDDAATREVVRHAIRTRAPVPLAGVLRDAEAYLVLHGVAPWPEDARQAPRIVEPAGSAPPPEPSSHEPSSPEPDWTSDRLPDRTPDRLLDRMPDQLQDRTSDLPPDQTREPVGAAGRGTASADMRTPTAAGRDAVGRDDAAARTPLRVLTRAQWSAVDALERSVQGFEQDVASVRRLGSSPLAGGEASRLGVLPTLQKVDDIDRDAVAFAHSVGLTPYSREARHALFDKLRERMRESGMAPAQIAELDVVVAMFDYVLDERRLPASARPLVWRLQQPVMALSLLDPGYLADEPRSLRRLVENFGAIAVGYSEDLVKDGELYRRLETVVRAMEIIASGLQVRSAVIARQVEREYQRASNSVSKLVNRVVNERSSLEASPGRRNRRDLRHRPGREREREVTEQVRRLLTERVADSGAPDSVNAFLQSVWLRHLRTTILRDGESSAPFRRSLGVVDDLLWTLESGNRSHSRSEFANRIPSLIKLLNVGIREVDAKDAEYKAFFDELFLIHLRRMRDRGGDGRQRAPVDTGPVPAEMAATATGILLPASTALPGASVDVWGGARLAAEPSGERAFADPAASVTRAAQTRVATAAPTAPGSLIEPGLELDDLVPDPLPAGSPPSAEPITGVPLTGVPITGVPVAVSPATAAELAPRPAGRAAEARHGVTEVSDRHLFEVLNSLDLSDAPLVSARVDMPPEQAVATLRRGMWIEVRSSDGSTNEAKVAWINPRRTVVLLVRHPDRKALSLRLSELKIRFERGHAYRLR
ncbi:MAG: DUF1631 family protein [Burkholderiaceae bacterium]